MPTVTAMTRSRALACVGTHDDHRQLVARSGVNRSDDQVRAGDQCDTVADFPILDCRVVYAERLTMAILDDHPRQG
jgi:hypothetical protein